jgi:hypothetical protein
LETLVGLSNGSKEFKLVKCCNSVVIAEYCSDGTTEPLDLCSVLLYTTQEYPVLLENALQPLLLPGRGFFK